MFTFEHFSCICINFNSKRVEYLDNRSYDRKIEEESYGIYGRALVCILQTILFWLLQNFSLYNLLSFCLQADLVGQYLCTKGIQKGADVRNFEFFSVPFSWQLHASEAGATECGLYTMMHMLLYNGELFDCDLASKTSRKLYRAELVATLVLSDSNNIRSEVLGSIEEFEKCKKSLLPTILEKRKIEKHRLMIEMMKKQTPEQNKIITPDDSKNEIPESISGSVLGSRKRSSTKIHSDGLGCTADCGQKFTKPLLVSKFMRDNQTRFADMNILRKEVLDYCFFIDYRYHME